MHSDYSKSKSDQKANILLIYTGGTIGMKQDPETLALVPFNFEEILAEVPELKKIVHTIDTHSFDPPVDSSDIEPSRWKEIADVIYQKYDNYDGFVILHGTDTMSYSASALGFMMENLEKPVIFTGSQLPVGMLRTDGKENLISAIEIAAARDTLGRAIVPEVCIYFGSQLFRGNRTTKDNAENFNAFRSPNYPPLAEAGIHIKYNQHYINYPSQWGRALHIKTSTCNRVAVMRLFPGITPEVVKGITGIPGLRALVLETYGSGNATTRRWFLDILEEAVQNGLIILNVSQCPAGKVDMEAYATGIQLKEMGVISGHDSTLEAAVTKLFFLLGHQSENNTIKELLNKNLKGEISIN